MDYKNYGHLANISLGNEKSSLVLKNAKVINVFSEEIIPASIAIENGIIVGVGDYSGKTEIDLAGRYVCPGFIDSHLHLESTLTDPSSLIQVALGCGTTTFIVDPHEAANVSGEAGIDYILNQTESTDANVFVMLPSCVPASEFEENGCTLTAEKMAPYLKNKRVLGLGEVMDYESTTHAKPEMMAKLELFRDRVKDGHAPSLTDKQLAAYALAKIKTDHEAISYEYAVKEIRSGIYVHIREGSGARNLEAIVTGIVENKTDTERFCFCTDDKHISDIEVEGHINHNVKKSIKLGIDPIKAIKMATINSATCYGFQNLGAIAPGYRADLIVLDDLENIGIHSVYCDGKLVGKDYQENDKTVPANLLNTIHIPKITAENIALPLKSNETIAIEVIEGQIVTRKKTVKVELRDGYFVPDSNINKLVVIERHKMTGHVGVAPLIGYGIKNGAVGTSMSHDSHNIVIVGDNDADILIALDELYKNGGGYTIVSSGEIVETLPLPIMGLMTTESGDIVNEKLCKIIAKAHEMGIPQNLDPMVVLSFVALTVLPEIRLTTKGLFDVEKQKFIER